MKKINADVGKVLMSKPLMIGIYGDSFTAPHAQANHFAWFNLLATKLGGMVYNFDTNKSHQSYGSGGAPTFETYKKFKKYFRKHDINIMTVTDSWRFPSGIQLEKFGRKYLGYSNVIEFLENEQQNLTSKEIETIEHLKSWYLVNDTEFMELAQELMLREIETLCPNVLLLPASASTFKQERKNKSPFHFDLWGLHTVQCKSLGIHNKVSNHTKALLYQEEKHDKIACHLTFETNTVLAELIYDYLDKGKIVELPTTIKHNHDWTHYFHNPD